ncbi:MAG: D-alanyl-D-alanine carboxypeptidase [Nitrospirae bacterium]|nr:D-alanyl-D-alanine carboxypeptidase [Nitrospirota bacterium]
MKAISRLQYIVYSQTALIAFLAMCAHAVSDPFPGAAKAYALYVNEKLLWAHEPELILPPASLTKIMTALIVLEQTRLNDIVTVSMTAERETGTKLNLKAGEKYHVIDLLAAVLIHSANDACLTLTEHISGSEREFVKAMNRRSLELGLKRTKFRNACGHDMQGHYSTANDISKIAFTALRNKTFAKMVSLVYGTISTVDGKREIHLENKNELIGRYNGAIGVKTGFTLKAGQCLIALAERDGTKVLLVLLNAPDRWWKAVAMLDNAFTSANKIDIRQ